MKRSGLGKGLSAIIPADVREQGSRYREIPVDMISPNPHQPRRDFDEEGIAELAESIREVGLLQPLVVRETGEGGYELVAGERRLRALKRLGIKVAPAVIVEGEGAASLEKALVENVQRQDLNPLEEAAAYLELSEKFGLTHEQIAARVGRSRSVVTNKIRLLQLPEVVQMFVKEGRLSEGHARALLGTPDRALQEQLARRAVEESLSVREVEALVRETLGRVRPQESLVAAEPAAGRSEEASDPAYEELAELLAERLNTRVRVEAGRSKGRIVIEFADLEDLERIFRLMFSVHPQVNTQAVDELEL